ncbi:hypothetical protein V8C42DRAFT_337353 [Trichoderma barbatum]
MKTLAHLNPPAALSVSNPITVMLDHMNKARNNLRLDPRSAIDALNEATNCLIDRYNLPREWKLLMSEANLSICPKEAMNIAERLLAWKKTDVEALMLAGRASYLLEDYGSALKYFQAAECCDPWRSGVREWLEESKMWWNAK